MTSEGALRIGQAAFKPITWSPNDTAATVRQVKIHNQVGVELGLWKYPAPRKLKPKPRPVTAQPIVQPVPQEPADFEGKPVEPVTPTPPSKKKKWWQRKM